MDFKVLDQIMMAQANIEVISPMKPNVNSTISRVRDFYKMKYQKFYGSKAEEDPQEFVNMFIRYLLL